MMIVDDDIVVILKPHRHACIYTYIHTQSNILLDCVDFIEMRSRHFNVNSFKELF